MFGKSAAVLALAAVCAVVGAQSSQAGSENSPWYDTNSNAALSRANLSEKVLSRSAITKIKYLRSVVAPPVSPKSQCPQEGAVAPVLVGGDLYAITAGKISKYDAATGSLIWRSTPNQQYVYESLAVSDNLVIAGGVYCFSESEPAGLIEAFNASTGAHVWSSGIASFAEAVAAGSYVIAAGDNAAGYDVAVYNITDGTSVWGGEGCGGPPSSPVVVDSLVMSYGCSQDPQNPVTLQASNLATGALAWSLTGNWSIQRGDQSGANGKHFYATDPTGTVVDLTPLTGQVEYSLSQAVTVLAVDNSRVYATCGSQGQDLCGYNSGTGALEWQDTPIATPALAAEADGVLYLDYGSALNTATGKRITTIWSNYSTAATALAVGDGRIAVVSDPRIIDLYGLQGY